MTWPPTPSPRFALSRPISVTTPTTARWRPATRWLARWVPQILASPAYRDGTTAVFVVWDEYTPTPNLIVAPSVPAGASLCRAG